MSKTRSFPVSFLFPNIITLAGLCVGLSAIRFAMLGRWELAVGLLLLSAVIDGMDGRVARMLNATSTFGANLDSLADFVSFGIVPGIILYMWQLQYVKGLGWLVVLLFAVCMCLRLARFNTRIFDPKYAEDKSKADEFFTGVPAPAGALLAVLPMVINFEWGAKIAVMTADFPRLMPYVYVGYLAVIALLLVSTIPTISVKKFKISSAAAIPVMLISGIIVAGFIIELWLTFMIIAVLYLCFIPYGMIRARKA